MTDIIFELKAIADTLARNSDMTSGDAEIINAVIERLRTAEQERDQYRKWLAEKNSERDDLVEELESIRTQLQEASQLAADYQSEAVHYSGELNKLRAQIKEAQEPVAEVHRHGKSGDYYLVELKNRAIHKGLKLYAAPVIQKA